MIAYPGWFGLLLELQSDPLAVLAGSPSSSRASVHMVVSIVLAATSSGSWSTMTNSTGVSWTYGFTVSSCSDLYLTWTR